MAQVQQIASRVHLSLAAEAVAVAVVPTAHQTQTQALAELAEVAAARQTTQLEPLEQEIPAAVGVLVDLQAVTVALAAQAVPA